MFRMHCLILLSMVAAPMDAAGGRDPMIAAAYYSYTIETYLLEPDPIPDSDKCENCNGTGRVGDGTIERVCPVCDGTGKKTKAAEEVPAVTESKAKVNDNGPRITLYSGRGSGASEAWKTWELPKLWDANFRVFENTRVDHGIPIPSVRVGNQVMTGVLPTAEEVMRRAREQMPVPADGAASDKAIRARRLWPRRGGLSDRGPPGGV